MFSRRSRYRKLPDTVTVDIQGRSLPSKTLRLLPEVSGAFLHTVEEVDRLDHLAYKYYNQSRKWWRISDANPEFMSPQALLGKEPVVTERFPLIFDDAAGQPPWAALGQRLTATVGVIDIQVVEETELVRQIQAVGERQVAVYVDSYERAVILTYNLMNLDSSLLADAMSDLGFDVGEPQRVGRVGKTVIIPPDIVG